MTIRRPTQDQLAEIAADFGFSLTPVEVAAYTTTMLTMRPSINPCQSKFDRACNVSLVT